MVDICFSSDDNYIEHLATAIASILKSSFKDTIYNFHILDGGISELNKSKILQLKKFHEFNCNFYDMSVFNFEQFPLNREYISVATYYRLLLLDIIPANINKLLYLDCDIIVKNDLSELYNEDIEDFLAGVVEDEGSLTQIKRLGLPVENNYFNAGVILFNVKKLREFGFKEKCFDYFKKNQDKITLQDQDILNGVLNGECKYLDLRFNANGRLYRENDLERHYTLDDEIKAKKNPVIIHYTDTNKPWNKKCKHPLQYEYFKYKIFTPFKMKTVKECIYFILKRVINQIFSIKNIISRGKKYKQITILGIKIKFNFRK